MAVKVIMPKQGLQMTEGVITKWLVEEGGDCVCGQPLFEMETDKLVITIDADASGKLLKIIAQEGDTVPITETIAVIGLEGEDISALLKASAGSAAQETAAEAFPSFPPPLSGTQTGEAQSSAVLPGATPRARWRAEENGISVGQLAGTGPDGLVIERDVLSAVPVKATPLARVLAGREEVPLDAMQGTGAHGKITRADVEAFAVSRRLITGERDAVCVPYEGKRKMIGEKMAQSLRIHAQLSHQIKVDMSRAVELRECYKANGRKVSYNDIILFATARALVDFPMVNAELTDGGIFQKRFVHLGMAVDTPTGLIVPVIRDADLLRLSELSARAAELAEKAKSGRLAAPEYTGSTFTVSNLGMFGLESFVPILNTPESGILGVGAIEKEPVVIAEEIVIRPVMRLTLTYDHRVIDGAPAAQFLARVKQYLESPSLLL